MKKNRITFFALSTLVLIGALVTVLFEKKSIKEEEIEGLKIGMSLQEARKKIPTFFCDPTNGFKCSAIVNGAALEVAINADEQIYAILSAVTINSMDLNQVMSAAKQEYKKADHIEDDNRFYWYFDKKGDAYKYISITQNDSYPWFCSSYTSGLKPPNCTSNSIMLVKRIVDNRMNSVWFDKNSPELNKIK